VRRLILVLAMLAPLSGMAGFEEGLDAYNRGDYATAVAEIRPLADQGDARAQYFIATLAHYGYGEPRDPAKAAQWFRRAAEQGHALSQYHLGQAYEKGAGVTRDLVAAHMWLSISAATTDSYRDAHYARDIVRKLEKRMKEDDIARARQMAADWTPGKK
jgi:uncharacterized protein